MIVQQDCLKISAQMNCVGFLMLRRFAIRSLSLDCSHVLILQRCQRKNNARRVRISCSGKLNQVHVDKVNTLEGHGGD